MILNIADLIYINDAAKALKCKYIMWIDNKIVGVDNFNYIVYTTLNPDNISIFPTKGYIINQRNLSKFIKSISIESQFNIDESLNKNTISTLTNILDIECDKRTEMMVKDRLNNALNIDNSLLELPEEDMTDKLSMVYKLTKSSGAIHYKYDDNHIMTLFSGILPLAKSDKFYLKLSDNSNNTFIVRFIIKKKQFNIYVYLLYLKI